MHITHDPTHKPARQMPTQTTENSILTRCMFWLPTLLILLAIVVPDFETRHAQSAAGVEVESDLLAMMATDNSLREKIFEISLISLAGVGAVLFLIAGRGGRHPASFQVWIVAAAFAFVVASLLWSDDRSLTFRRSAITGLFMVGAWGVGRAWRPMQLVHMVLLLSALFAISGLMAEAYYSTLLAGDSYRFSGLLHPNRQALSCGLFVLAAMTKQSQTGNRFYWMLALWGYGLLLLTGSRGGALACAMAVIFQLILATPPSKRITWALSASFLMGAGLLFMALEPHSGSRLERLAKMGRSDAMADPRSLTGRLPIWAEMIDGIQDRPAIGHGYSAYWTPDRIRRLSYIHDWEFNNAHSIYLEVLLSVGIAGFALILTGLLLVFVRGLRLFHQNRDLGLAFILSVFVMALINGLIESIFVSPGYEFMVALIGTFMIVYYPNLGARPSQ